MGMDDLKKQELFQASRSVYTEVKQLGWFHIKKKIKAKGEIEITVVWVFEHFIIFITY